MTKQFAFKYSKIYLHGIWIYTFAFVAIPLKSRWTHTATQFVFLHIKIELQNYRYKWGTFVRINFLKKNFFCIFNYAVVLFTRQAETIMPFFCFRPTASIIHCTLSRSERCINSKTRKNEDTIQEKYVEMRGNLTYYLFNWLWCWEKWGSIAQLKVESWLWG
jgi:hypothetical protein